MDIFETLYPLSEKIQNELHQSVKADFPQTLKEPIYYFLEASGKKIRPLLTLLSCQAVGGDMEAALAAAAGIELFHDFTLVHDDIMDQDDLRRGRSTIHKLWDEGTAILVGDALIGMAYANMIRCDARHLPAVLHHFSEAVIKVCEGQALDKEFEHRESIDIDTYLDMIAKKTGWLFKLACQTGAILAGGTPRQVETMLRFGESLGVGFQIQDDLLDFIADETVLGKKVGSDLKLDKKTYITLQYGRLIEQRPELLDRYPRRMWDFKSIQELKDALHDLGIVETTQRVVDGYIRRALECLEEVQPLDERNHLLQIVHFLQRRQY